MKITISLYVILIFFMLTGLNGNYKSMSIVHQMTSFLFVRNNGMFQGTNIIVYDRLPVN